VATTRRVWTDEDVEQWIGRLLQVGVLLAAVIALIGGALYLRDNGSHPATYSVFHGVPEELTNVHQVVIGALQLRGAWLIQLGLLLLIATPVARVVLSLLAFARQHDRTYVLISGIVLALLLYSLLGPGT
jgi:uncharacterized membrane protein